MAKRHPLLPLLEMKSQMLLRRAGTIPDVPESPESFRFHFWKFLNEVFYCLSLRANGELPCWYEHIKNILIL